jgi:hypothetical protein
MPSQARSRGAVAGQPDDPAWPGNEPPQACTAWRNPEADPVGRGRGPPVPPDGRPCGGVTPWRSRHCRKAESCDVPEPDDDELAPQSATARTAVSATAPSTPGLAAWPGKLGEEWVNDVSLAGGGPAHAVQARTWRSASSLQSRGRALRSRCACLGASWLAARASSRAAGHRTWFRFRCPHWRPVAGGRGTRPPGYLRAQARASREGNPAVGELSRPRQPPIGSDPVTETVTAPGLWELMYFGKTLG